MSASATASGGALAAEADAGTFDLHVRGQIPSFLTGSLIIAMNRRNKDRSVFSRWHDSQSDLLRMDLYPGRPGRIKARFLSVDPSGAGLRGGLESGRFYVVQPNHATNTDGGTVWATNLLFGAPLEVDLAAWQPRRVLRFLAPDEAAPQLTSTSHFAFSSDRRYAYFHQSLFAEGTAASAVSATNLSLIELDTRTGSERIWEILPPPDDAALESANFHSAFCFEESGRRFVGLLKTGAILDCLEPHILPRDHPVRPMPASTVWIIGIDHGCGALQAELLPGIGDLGGVALSHLEVDVTGGDGFVLYANYKQADVSEETHGENIYGEKPGEVREHYSGMIIEPFNYGMVIRYERRGGATSLHTFSRPYLPGMTSLGHSWLPINLELDSSRTRLFASFHGFQPRLLPRHVAEAYTDRAVDPTRIRYVPPLLMRFDAATLQPAVDHRRTHLSYAESMAFAVAGEGGMDYVITFAPEPGLRIYPAEDLTRMICHATSPLLITWRDTHFRPDPAHLQFVPR